jgi:hypothetical protein
LSGGLRWEGDGESNGKNKNARLCRDEGRGATLKPLAKTFNDKY